MPHLKPLHLATPHGRCHSKKTANIYNHSKPSKKSITPNPMASSFYQNWMLCGSLAPITAKINPAIWYLVIPVAPYLSITRNMAALSNIIVLPMFMNTYKTARQKNCKSMHKTVFIVKPVPSKTLPRIYNGSHRKGAKDQSTVKHKYQL